MQPIIAVAPMMGYTDRYCRYFLRLIASDVRLYTEMITAQALIHGNAQHLLAFHPKEKYIALQLGGSDPKKLALAAKMGEASGYDEINFNVGCPSPRVSAGRFGACLMLEPHLVAECIAAMHAQVKIPVSVKCRIGVDDIDSYTDLYRFVAMVAAVGCQIIIVHARKAWLAGLSPKQNREVPPLCYQTVYQIKKDFPRLTIIINGGIQTVADVARHLSVVDGVMIGRAAYANPYLLAQLQQNFLLNKKILTRQEVLEALFPVVQQWVATGIKLNRIVRHLLGLFNGQPGAASWRRYLTQTSDRIPSI